ncbi:MAG: alpha/beta hydrolase family protein [Solirubrobacterales bacterium]
MPQGSDRTGNRPQEPVEPLPYDREEIRIDTPIDGVTLAGTLTRPRTPGPHPAALLITGSGPHDRDETVFGHRPFLVLADHLTRLGLAVLRLDDRGVGGSTGNRTTATSANFAADARAGFDFLRLRPEIDPRRTGMVGHSEGAVIAPMLAAESTHVAWIVMLAGAGVSGELILLAQADLINEAAGVPQELRTQLTSLGESMYAVVNSEPDDETAQARIGQLIESAEQTIGSAAGADAAQLLAQIKSQVPRITTRWFRYFLRYDPAPALGRVGCPVLALNGELDLQVPATQNLPTIVAALEAGGNPDYEAAKLPRLNHLFQTAETGSPTEYAAIEETFAPAALKLLTDWLWRHGVLAGTPR